MRGPSVALPRRISLMKYGIHSAHASASAMIMPIARLPLRLRASMRHLRWIEWQQLCRKRAERRRARRRLALRLVRDLDHVRDRARPAFVGDPHFVVGAAGEWCRK